MIKPKTNENIHDRKQYEYDALAKSETDIRKSIRNFDYNMFWQFIDATRIRVQFSLSKTDKNTQRNQTESFPIASTRIVTSPASVPMERLNYFQLKITTNEFNDTDISEMNTTRSEDEMNKSNDSLDISVTISGLKKRETYSICIQYYEKNYSNHEPIFYLCQEIINDYEQYVHGKSVTNYGPMFILRQYTIIFIFLITLQILFYLHERQAADVVHRHLINRAQRFRSSFSSINLVRNSISSTVVTAVDETNQFSSTRDSVSSETQHFTINPMSVNKISYSNSAALSKVDCFNRCSSHEPILKTVGNKNHVQFLLGENEEAEDSDDNETNKISPVHMTTNHSPSQEPYRDRSDALLSMAHILDMDKPWHKYKRQSISNC